MSLLWTPGVYGCVTVILVKTDQERRLFGGRLLGVTDVRILAGDLVAGGPDIDLHCESEGGAGLEGRSVSFLIHRFDSLCVGVVFST